MTCLRPILTCVVILTLGLATIGAGVARGQASAVGEMVICTGYGIVTVSYDAEGNPVERPTLCPDAVATLLAATALTEPTPAVIEASICWRDWPCRTVETPVQRLRSRGARAPPA